MFQAFDEYLASSFSVDYWSDEAIVIAEAKLAEFSNLDWEKLRLSIEYRGPSWLERCAEVLGEHEGDVVVDILMKLAANESSEVKIAALDSLNSLLSRIHISIDLVEKLKVIVDATETSSAVETIMLESMKKKIN